MKFCKYYSKILDSHGVPHLNIEQHRRAWNIISLENRLQVLYDLRDQENYGNKNRYDMDIMHYQRQLTVLTKNANPKEVMDEMVLLSNQDLNYFH